MSDWQNALDNALQAAATHEFGVIPLSLRKLPALASPHKVDPPGTPKCRGECGRFGHGVHDATSDPDRIRAMFEAARHATGYGIACGRPPHYLIGLDLDRDAEKQVDGVWELRKLCARKGIAVPRTVIIRTPRGGYHAWWTGPSDVKVPNRAGQIAPGVDVRHSGGYLVGPGSRGERGLYTLASDPDAVTVHPIPEQLLTLMTATKEQPRRIVGARAAAPASGGRALVALVKFVLDAAEGQRNNRLYWAACKAFEHAAAGRLDANQAEDALTRAAFDIGLPDKEAEATLRSARDEVLGAA
ncbi:DNA primase [Streptomyces sp. SID8379]|uniref:bifunctional DNA primase/polymerase n=1 Tax=unclassified Streptomyces TaxID=2593676 RepID=UPI0003630F4A|nr:MULTISPECIES: bifunctional DNA primase/polymerase [unclassified Streptomyces]MYW66278.1 DNA primase [Streptomyces sp. SID8379]